MPTTFAPAVVVPRPVGAPAAPLTPATRTTPLDARALQGRLAAFRAAAYARGEVPCDDGAMPIWPVGIQQPAADFLRDLVVREKAAAAVETGLGLGLSALAIAEGLLMGPRGGEARHVVLDPMPHLVKGAGLRVLRDSGAGAIVEHQARDSTVGLPALLESGERFDFAYVDGAHWFEYVFIDLFNALRLVRPGGLVVVDDHWMPAVQTALAFFHANHGARLELFDPAGPGARFVGVRAPEAPVERAWDHFAPFPPDALPPYAWRR